MAGRDAEAGEAGDAGGAGGWRATVGEAARPTKPQGEPEPAGPQEARRAEIERLTARRDNARWSAVVGFGLLFAASFSTAFLFGGVAMIVYGASASILWSTRLRRLKGDPWDYDPELDGPQAPAWARHGHPPPRHEGERVDQDDDGGMDGRSRDSGDDGGAPGDPPVDDGSRTRRRDAGGQT